jgi:hypothetical protein
MSAARIVPAWVLCLTAVLTVTLSLLPTRSASAVTVGQVTNWCSSPDVGANSKLCHAYVAAALQLLRTPDRVLNGGHRYKTLDACNCFNPDIGRRSRAEEGMHPSSSYLRRAGWAHLQTSTLAERSAVEEAVWFRNG